VLHDKFVLGYVDDTLKEKLLWETEPTAEKKL